MLLHIGGDVSILKKHVIGIFDIEKTDNAATKEFLQTARDSTMLSLVSKNEKNKSFIVTGEKVYLSPISSTTLYKRFLEDRQSAF